MNYFTDHHGAPGYRAQGFRPLLGVWLCPHERVAHAVALAVVGDQPSVVDDAAGHRVGHVGVAEYRAPAREVDVGGEQQRDLLVAKRYHAEQQLGPVGVARQVAPLVQDDQVALLQGVELLLEPALPVGGVELQDQLGGLLERHPLALPARDQPQRDGRARLAVARAAVENDVLLAVHEPAGEHLPAAEVGRKLDALPREAPEVLGERKARLPSQPGYPVRDSQVALASQQRAQELELAVGGLPSRLPVRRRAQQHRARPALHPLEPVEARLRLDREPSHCPPPSPS